MYFCPNCLQEIPKEHVCPKCGFEIYKYEAVSHHIPPSTILNGKYLLGRVIGEGGFGITYIGLDLNLQLKVAIKEYFPRSISNRNDVNRTVMPFTQNEMEEYRKGIDKFLDEARRLARFIDLPHVASVKDYFQEKNTAYIVMEYIEGCSLKELVESNGRGLPMSQVITIVTPIMESLQVIHKNGLVHRDISPKNIMIDKNGQSKLIDFGAARSFNFLDKKLNTVVVTDGFAPPEQYSSQGMQGPWTDVYAMCATIYYAITGQLLPSSYDRVNNKRFQTPSELGVQITRNQEQALLQGLELDIAKRIPDISVLKQRLTMNYGGSEFKTIAPTKRGTTVEKKKISSSNTHTAIIVGIGILIAIAGIYTIFDFAKKYTTKNTVKEEVAVRTEQNNKPEISKNKAVYGKSALFNGSLHLFGVPYAIGECKFQDFLDQGWYIRNGEWPDWEDEDPSAYLYYTTPVEYASIILFAPAESEPVDMIVVSMEDILIDESVPYDAVAFQEGVAIDSSMDEPTIIELFGAPDMERIDEEDNTKQLIYIGFPNDIYSEFVFTFDMSTGGLFTIWYYLPK